MIYVFKYTRYREYSECTYYGTKHSIIYYTEKGIPISGVTKAVAGVTFCRQLAEKSEIKD